MAQNDAYPGEELDHFTAREYDLDACPECGGYVIVPDPVALTQGGEVRCCDCGETYEFSARYVRTDE